MRRHTPGLFIFIVLFVTACGAGTQAPTTAQSDPPAQRAAAQPVVLAAQDIKFDRADLQGTVGQPPEPPHDAARFAPPSHNPALRSLHCAVAPQARLLRSG